MSPTEDMSVGAIMRHTGLPKADALAAYRALLEAQDKFNEAKQADHKEVTITRATVWRLATLAGVALGMTNLTETGDGG